MAKKQNFIVKFHHFIGGAWGWVALLFGLALIGLGIFAVIGGTTATIAGPTTTSIVTLDLSQLTGISPQLMKLAGGLTIGVGSLVVLAILLIPPLVRHQKDKKSAALNEEIKAAGLTHMQESQQNLLSPRITHVPAPPAQENALFSENEGPEDFESVTPRDGEQYREGEYGYM